MKKDSSGLKQYSSLFDFFPFPTWAHCSRKAVILNFNNLNFKRLFNFGFFRKHAKICHNNDRLLQKKYGNHWLVISSRKFVNFELFCPLGVQQKSDCILFSQVSIPHTHIFLSQGSRVRVCVWSLLAQIWYGDFYI